ncbi:hypothetical protein ABPG75_004355 [Micractinium tetrahymenae]
MEGFAPPSRTTLTAHACHGVGCGGAAPAAACLSPEPPAGAASNLLGTQTDPARIIMRYQRTLYSSFASWPASPSPWPPPYVATVGTAPPKGTPAKEESDDEHPLVPSAPPAGGLDVAFVAANAGLNWLHCPEPACQLLAHSPSPPPAAATRTPVASLAPPAATASPTPATAALPASAVAAPAGGSAASGATKFHSFQHAAVPAAAAPAEQPAAALCAALVKPEPVAAPTGFAACSAPEPPTIKKCRKLAPRKVLSPAPAIKKERGGAGKPVSKAASGKKTTSKKAAAALLSAVKEECKMEVEDVAPVEPATVASCGDRRKGAPSPRRERQRRHRGGGRRQPTGNTAGRPRGGASPFAGLAAAGMFRYYLDEGGDVLGCKKEAFAAQWSVNTSSFMTKCQTFIRKTETAPSSRAGSVVLDRARIKHEGLACWEAFAAKYLAAPAS